MVNAKALSSARTEPLRATARKKRMSSHSIMNAPCARLEGGIPSRSHLKPWRHRCNYAPPLRDSEYWWVSKGNPIFWFQVAVPSVWDYPAS